MRGTQQSQHLSKEEWALAGGCAVSTAHSNLRQADYVQQAVGLCASKIPQLAGTATGAEPYGLRAAGGAPSL